MSHADTLSRNSILHDKQGRDVDGVNSIFQINSNDWLATVQNYDLKLKRNIDIQKEKLSEEISDIKKKYRCINEHLNKNN